MDEQIKIKTFTLSQDCLERHEPDPLEAKLLSPGGKEALMMARAIIFIAPMMRFNPREYRVKIVYEAHTDSFRAYCTPQEASIMMLKPLSESELLESYLEWEKKEKEKGKIYPRPVENYYGFITPRAKFRNIDEALCGSAMQINF